MGWTHVLAVVALAATSCSVSVVRDGDHPVDWVIDAIEDTEAGLAAKVGLDLDASCEDPGDLHDGDTFDCQATSETGEVFRFRVAVTDADDFVNGYMVNGLNVLDGHSTELAVLGEIEDELRFTPTDLDCGGDVIFKDRGDPACTFTSPAGETLEVILVVAEDGSYRTKLPYPGPELQAVKLIETDMAASLGMELVATCPAPADAETGETFECTAVNAAGDVVGFEVYVADKGVTIVPTNVIEIAALEGELLRNWTQAGGEPDDMPFDCGEGWAVMDAEGAIGCTAIDPATGDDHDAKLFIDLETGEWSFEVDDKPR